MNVLVVGSGGREHALVWKLAQSPRLEALDAAPGNPGIASLATCHPVAPADGEALLALCREREIDLVVVGPEAPLVAGVADVLRHGGVPVFGPSAAAARIEGSKAFAKEVMEAAGVATARRLDEPRAPCVVKADGLAAGKGVFVCRTQREAEAAWQRARAPGGGVLVEELLEGEEVSLFAVSDGAEALVLPPVRDAKRLRDGDEGPNTGGMGAYSPVPFLGDFQAERLADEVHRPVLGELARRGTPFVGLLYAGLMLTEDGPRVLEFNCRFGDPETQALAPRLDGDLLDVLAPAAGGNLGGAELAVSDDAAVTVVLASTGYPDAPVTGTRLSGVEAAERRGALVFHAGTAIREGALVSAGGRVLAVTATGTTVDEARERAYAAVAAIEFPDACFRRDIGVTVIRVG
ncbi:MAG: phosphoribosylamine--glycine ligase [Actinomycetota bacterium]|nr:phosphoribosylamine--glycine ligase [Actinomycetota bacterium]